LRLKVRKSKLADDRNSVVNIFILVEPRSKQAATNEYPDPINTSTMATTITTTTVTTTTTTTVEADRKETTAAATTYKVSEQIKEESCRSFFNGFFRTKAGLKTFYPNGATEEHIKKAVVMANELLSERLGCPSREAAICLSVLQFYDLVLFVGGC
jgi:uncharacterized membrane protein